MAKLPVTYKHKPVRVQTIEDIWDIIDEVCKTSKEFTDGQTLFYSVPFFADCSLLVEKWMLDMINEYNYTTRFNISLGELDNVSAQKIMADKKLNIKVRADGAKRAKKDIKGVETGITSLGKAAAKSAVAFVGAAGLITGLKTLVRLTAEQEIAEKKLETALGKTSKALLDQASALQKVAGIGDEVIIVQQAFLASLKFTEEQIKEIITVAIDLSAATGIELESAVRNTAKTFSGLAGELGELIPQLRTLTTEEMKAGEAVKLMADLFGGQALKQSDTLTRSLANLQNVKKTADNLTLLAEAVQKEGVQEFFALLNKSIVEATPSLNIFNKGMDLINKALGRRNEIVKEAKEIGVGEELFTTEQAIELGVITKDLEAKTLQIRKQSFVQLELQEVTYKEINSASKKAAEFAAQTASSLMTSAVMGDDIAEGLKRAVIQLGIMVAQAKILKALTDAGSIFGGGGFLGSAVNFLFGASPTQTAPSASSASNAKITINQSFGGMGVIDHNFAANSIIPAINKAISTGQARIN